MSGINQIQMSFNPAEDRILVRMNTIDAAGFQFWFTRRYVKLLWPMLLSMLTRDEQVAAQQTEQARQEMLSFQQQDIAEKMDYSQEFEAQETQPLGADPILLERIAINESSDGSQILCMHPADGQGIELVLNQTLLHSICKLLYDTVIKTEWELELSQGFSMASAMDDPEHRTIN